MLLFEALVIKERLGLSVLVWVLVCNEHLVLVQVIVYAKDTWFHFVMLKHVVDWIKMVEHPSPIELVSLLGPSAEP